MQKFKLLFRWVYGIGFCIAGLGILLSVTFIGGLLITISGLLLLPPTYGIIENRVGKSLAAPFKYSTVIGFWLVGCIIFISYQVDNDLASQKLYVDSYYSLPQETKDSIYRAQVEQPHTAEAKALRIVETSRNVVVSSSIVKKVDGQYRYFFDIRNHDSQPFSGDVKLYLITENESGVFDKIFVNEIPIRAKLGAPVYMDMRTGTPDTHGEYGIDHFKYEILVDGSVVGNGTGAITDKFEDLDRLLNR